MNVLICDDEWRVKVHDFQAHLNTLQDLLQNQEYDAAEQYLNSVSKEQTDRPIVPRQLSPCDLGCTVQYESNGSDPEGDRH